MLISERSSEIEQNPEDRQAWFRSMWEAKEEEDVPPAETEDNEQNDEADDNDDFGDDFDDFAEGGEDDDFGDFDDEPTTPGVIEANVPEQPLSYSLPEQLAGLVSSHAIYHSTLLSSLTPLSAIS